MLVSLKFLLQTNLRHLLHQTGKLQTKKNDINTIEGHFTVIYHAKHTPKASNLLPKWPSDLSNCMGAVSKFAPGGDEIARVDDFDMPEHHSHGP